MRRARKALTCRYWFIITRSTPVEARTEHPITAPQEAVALPHLVSIVSRSGCTASPTPSARSLHSLRSDNEVVAGASPGRPKEAGMMRLSCSGGLQ